MNTFKKITLSFLLVLFSQLGYTATWSDCSSLISDKLVTNTGCNVYDEFVNDDLALINSAGGIFNETDWLFGGKEDYEGSWENTSDLMGLLITGNALAGTWSINDVWDAYGDIAFVFKDGRGTSPVAYLLTEGLTSGSFTTPFVDPPFNLPGNSGEHAISHISVYYREGETHNVPEPTTPLLLLLGGVLLLGNISLKNSAFTFSKKI
ncbi:MAG: PEP-CTERM sorting domain-containing protein [Candidatus Gracilibacteria bacterium]|nr:PEP-CTERM sorting domain-containing protein [Candidatus Gracilibacteria bacterium]